MFPVAPNKISLIESNSPMIITSFFSNYHWLSFICTPPLSRAAFLLLDPRPKYLKHLPL